MYRSLPFLAFVATATLACKVQDLAPQAVIEGPSEVAVGSWVQLEGVASSDPEGSALIYAWSFDRLPAGSATSFNEPSASNPSFLADAAGTYIVELTVDDGLIYSAPVLHEVVAIQGNRTPVADAGPDRAAPLGALVQLDGTASLDPDDDPLTFAWRLVDQPDGANAALSDPTDAAPTFVANQEGRFVWSLVVSDGALESAEDRVTISVGLVNLTPVADAGADRLALVGEPITLDGSRSFDPNGDALDYTWTFAERPQGSAATLLDDDTATPTFTPDVAGAYRAQLVVGDGAAWSAPDEVKVTAVLESEPPTADAGADQPSAIVGTPVQLDGSGSLDPDGDLLTYHWQLVALPLGSRAQLNDPGVVNPSFTPDVNGVYVAHLRVSDGIHVAGPAEVVVTASGENRPPVADAGGPYASRATGQIIQLDGSGSTDPDLDPITYAWSFLEIPGGSLAALNLATVVNPSFHADVAGEYTVGLVVHDGYLASPVDTVTITVVEGNAPPLASAIAQPTSPVPRDTLVQLVSTSTDDDDDPLFHTWWPVSLPAGSAAQLSDATIEDPWFIADVIGTYTFRLQVSDGTALSNVFEISVEAVEAGSNLPPVADAGRDRIDYTGDGGVDERATTGTPVTLDGAGSTDPNPNDVLEYLWRFVSVPPGADASFNTATADSPTFTPNVDGPWVIELTVSDGELTNSDRVIVESIGANQAPVAVACVVDPDAATNRCPADTPAPQRIVREGQTVQLDGSTSFDPDGDALNYHWSFRELPAGFFATFNQPNAVNPSFLADAPGTVVVRLRVDDGRAVSAYAEVVIEVLEAFKVVSFDPSNDTVGVALTESVTITFNQDVDSDTVTDSSVWLNPGGTSDLSQAVEVNYAFPSARQIVLDPIDPLDGLTQYTVTVTTAVRNTIGEPINTLTTSRFVTRAGEILRFTDPADGDEDVSVSTQICGTFTLEVDLDTVTDATFFATFLDAWGRTERVRWLHDDSTADNVVCFTPQVDEYDCAFDRPLLYDTTYTVTITTGLQLLESRDTLSEDYAWTFTTTSAPSVTETHPSDGADDVPIRVAPIEVRFDRMLDAGTVQGATVWLEEVGGPTIPGTAVASDDAFAVWFTPDEALDFDTSYRLTVQGGLDGVLDARGDWLMSDETVRFRTSTENASAMSPRQGTSVGDGSLIELLFDRPIDPTTMGPAAVEVYYLSGGTPVPISVSYAWIADTRVLSMTPTATLPGVTVRVAVTPLLEDHLGNPYPAREERTFSVSGSSQNAPGLTFGRENTSGHARYWVQGGDQLLLSSVRADTLFLEYGGVAVPWDIDEYAQDSSNRVYIRPLEYVLQARSPYRLRTPGGIAGLQRKDAGAATSGDFVIESTAPTVSTTSPASGATQVPGHATITVTFSERMDETSVTADSVRLLDGGVPVNATVALAADGLSATLQPVGYLDTGVTYTIQVTTAATDTAGNALNTGTGANNATFTVDTLAPTISAFSPTAPGEPDTDVTVTFGEPVDEASFIGSMVGADGTIRLYQGTAEAYLCVNVDGAVVTLDPVDPLPVGTWTLEVDAGVTDTAGNPLGTTFSDTFVIE